MVFVNVKFAPLLCMIIFSSMQAGATIPAGVAPILAKLSVSALGLVRFSESSRA
jgi:NAD(P)-dependent dehydrogenase (short-subunit alcohol dehydrogenase family)